jgi:hypothetical protein
MAEGKTMNYEPKKSFMRYWREGTAHAWVNIFADWQRERGVDEELLDQRKYVFAVVTAPVGLLIGLVRWFFVKRTFV